MFDFPEIIQAEWTGDSHVREGQSFRRGWRWYRGTRTEWHTRSAWKTRRVPYRTRQRTWVRKMVPEQRLVGYDEIEHRDPVYGWREERRGTKTISVKKTVPKWMPDGVEARWELAPASKPPSYDIERNRLNDTSLAGQDGQGLSLAEKLGLVLTGLATVVSFTIAEVTLGLIGITLLNAGPLGVVADLGLVVPAELFLMDIEIGLARYIYDAIKNDSKEGLEPQFILMDKIKSILEDRGTK